MDGRDHAGALGTELVLHLHGLHDGHPLPRLHHVAHLHLHLHHQPGHGRPDGGGAEGAGSGAGHLLDGPGALVHGPGLEAAAVHVQLPAALPAPAGHQAVGSPVQEEVVDRGAGHVG